MQARWLLSQFVHDDALGVDIPVCSAYGAQYFCPYHPVTPMGWALVQMLCDGHQLEAAAQDTRVVVCPPIEFPTPVPQAVIDAYVSWGATPGMSLGALLAKLYESEPNFAQSIA